MKLQKGVTSKTIKKILNRIGNTAIGGTITDVISNLSASITSHINNKSNPHSVTIGQIGAASATDLSTHINNKSNPHSVTKAQVGLGNCDNTSDANKSVKYATSAGSAVDQTARNSANAKLPLSGGTMTGSVDFGNKSMSSVYGIFSNGHPIALCSDNEVSVLNRAMNLAGTVNVGTLKYNYLTQVSYRNAKENIRDTSNDDFKKILSIPIHKFDYRPGFGDNRKDVIGAIVDEVEPIIPEAVVIPDNWDESSFNELKGSIGNPDMPSIDPSVFIYYLIGIVQEQQKTIDSISQTVNNQNAELLELKQEINDMKNK